MKININSIRAVSGDKLDSIRLKLPAPIKPVSGVSERVQSILESPTKIINRMKREQAALIAPKTEALKPVNGHTHLNLRTKPKSAVLARPPAFAKAKAVRVPKPKVVKKPRLSGTFYKQLRGTGLNTYNIRVPGYISQNFTEAPKSGNRAIVLIPSSYGYSVSDLPCVYNNVAKLDAKRGFDLKQIRHVRILSLTQAMAVFKKEGKQHTIMLRKREVTGWLIGKTSDPYCAFYDGKRFETLESIKTSGKANEHYFTLVK